MRRASAPMRRRIPQACRRCEALLEIIGDQAGVGPLIDLS
jgi:hypothetical protein